MAKLQDDNNYWASYWATTPLAACSNAHSQVGRTVHQVPIDDARWRRQLDGIEALLQLRPDDTLIDLCAGNGMITMPLSTKCLAVTAVDISSALVENIDRSSYPNIEVVIADLRNIDLPHSAFSRALMYGALQYFSEREAVVIFESIRAAMQPGGLVLIGDIPDIDRIFDFYCRPEWVNAYFDSLKAGTPAIGSWFKKDVLRKMAKYAGFSDAEIRAQPQGQINSHYRFDLVLTV